MGQLVCSQLSCQRGSFKLNVPELEIKEGEKIALLGENGCGKTSFLQVLTGLLPAQGEIFFNGESWSRLGAEKRARYMSYLPQESGLLFNLTVKELVELSLSSGHLEENKEREIVLKATEMTDFQDRIFHTLSTGERQRAMLARVLCRKSPLVFLDEPTAPLDMRHAAIFMNYLSSCSKAVVAAMHDLGLAVRYFDRFLLMKKGRIFFDRKKDELQLAELEEIYGIGLKRHGDCFIPVL